MAQLGIEPQTFALSGLHATTQPCFFSLTTTCIYQNVVKLLPMSRSRLFEGEMPQIFIVNNYAWQHILSYSPRSNSVQGQMSKYLEGQIPLIVNSNYLCMVICCKGQGYIARSVEGQSWLKDKYIKFDLFSLYFVTFNLIYCYIKDLNFYARLTKI